MKRKKKVSGGQAAKRQAGVRGGKKDKLPAARTMTAKKKTATKKKTAKKKATGSGMTKSKAVAARPRGRISTARPEVKTSHALAWRMRRQLLDPPQLRAPGNLAASLTRSGWLNSPSGSTPYLALAARYVAFARHEMDRAIFGEGVLAELPTVRGTTMVVPVEDSWIALQAYDKRNKARTDELIRTRRLMTRAELHNLEDVIRAVLAGMQPSAEILTRKVPARLVRDLGESGRRYNLTTSVDLALWNLLARGDVLSRPAERRLDRGGYEYVLRRDLRGPVVSADLRPREMPVFLQALTERYFSWAGPARLADFAWWADLTFDEARLGVKQAGLATLKLGGLKGGFYMLPEDLADLLSFLLPETPAVALVPFRDTLTGTWKTFDGLLEPTDQRRLLVGWGGKAVPARVAGPSGAHHHFLVAGGRIVGAWEQGADGVLRYATFGPLAADIEVRLARRAAAMAQFIHRELGEARLYAGAEGRAPTLEAAAGHWTRPTATIAPRA